MKRKKARQGSIPPVQGHPLMVATPQDVPSVKSVKSVVKRPGSMRPCDDEARGDSRPKGRAASSRSHSTMPPALPEVADRLRSRLVFALRLRLYSPDYGLAHATRRTRRHLSRH